MGKNFEEQFSSKGPTTIKFEKIERDRVMEVSIINRLASMYQSDAPYRHETWRCEDVDCDNGLYLGRLISLGRTERQRVDRFGFESIDGTINTRILDLDQPKVRKSEWQSGTYAILLVVDSTVEINAFTGPFQKIEKTYLAELFDSYNRRLNNRAKILGIMDILNRMPISMVGKEADSSVDEYCGHSNCLDIALSPYINDEFVTIGYARHELGNSYDSKAVAVYDYTGTKVGYLYKSQQEDYYSICDDWDAYPCVISGYSGRYDGKLRGYVWLFPRDLDSIHDIISMLDWCERRDIDRERDRDISVTADIDKLFDEALSKHSITLKITTDEQEEPNATNKPATEEQDAWIGCAVLLAIIVFVAYLIFN